ncbi:MAG TPA: amylovoran biosynthesis protein AmsF, partial [Erwinia persicina]|nr:amylovoran biosynthesis protein AmsF [Erwinia persicina]
MIEVNSFAELRTTAPVKAGDFALLKRYYDKDSTFRGGGTFVGFITTALPVDDGGTYAVGAGFFWKRVVNSLDELNIYHFGGKGDGVTDDSGAFKLMLNWAQTVNTSSRNLGVRFPGGKFLINPIDLSASEIPCFYLYGDDNPQGGMPRTTIVSNKSSSPVFRVNARRTTIKGISWNGQASADITANKGAITAEMCTNQQPFFENIMVAGQTVLITCFRVQNNGGTAIKLLDTLDSKFDQIYSINTYARVFDIGWSDTVKGVWDHSTAIELSNANFQSGYGDATLMMPRVTQGLISNVWIEHTRNPGDLSNGQWLVEALSLENCVNPLNMDNARMQIRQLN